MQSMGHPSTFSCRPGKPSIVIPIRRHYPRSSSFLLAHSSKDVRDCSYQALAARLLGLSYGELQEAVEQNKVASSIAFLSWLSQCHGDDYEKLGANLMSIREGLSQYRDLESIDYSKSTRAMAQWKGQELVPMKASVLTDELKTAKRRSVAAILGRTKTDTMTEEWLDSSSNIPIRIVAYLLTLDSDDMPAAVADAVTSNSVNADQEMDQNLDYLSATAIQLIAVIRRWHSEQIRSGFVQDIQSSIDLTKLTQLSQILAPYLQRQ